MRLKSKNGERMILQNQQKERPSWDHTFMTIAYEMSKRSHDVQTQHGCVIVKNNKILSTGYNGFIHGIDDGVLPNTRPEKYPWMIHSEINAILNCEHRPEGAIAYITGHPCLHCYQCMIQAGIAKIIYDASPGRNAIMIDDDMMEKIKFVQLLTNNNPKLIPYFYQKDLNNETI